MRTRELATVAGLVMGVCGLVSAPAWGQVMPPPPQESPDPRDEIPVRPAPPPRPVVNQPKPVVATPAYQSLVERDENGRVKPLSIPVDHAALARNPLIEAEKRGPIEEYLKERRSAFEKIIVDNLNTLELADGNYFDQISTEDPSSLLRMRDDLRPISAPAAPGLLATELQSRGLITLRQRELNETIAREYATSLVERPTKETPAEVRRAMTNAAVSVMAKMRYEEPLFVYHELLLEAAERSGITVPALGLATDVAQRVTNAISAAPADREGRLGAIRQAVSLLPYEKRQELLRRTIEARPTP